MRDKFTISLDRYTFWYNFDTVLYQFLETETSDRCHKVSYNAWDSQVSVCTPFQFIFTAPLRLPDVSINNFKKNVFAAALIEKSNKDALKNTLKIF